MPVVVGGCGGGRTSLLQRLRARLGPETVFVDLERVATTPERCLSSVLGVLRGHAAHADGDEAAAGTPRIAFDRLCRLFVRARGAGGAPITFLIDEFLEIRTFENFPGLRHAFATFTQSLCDSPNRFVITTRFAARTVRLFRDAPGPFEFVHLPPLTPAEVRTALSGLGLDGAEHQRRDTAGLVHALTGGRPRYVRLLAETAAAHGGSPVAALAAGMRPGAHLATACRLSRELRLHRARGRGALGAILHVLAADEPLTLTEIAARLGRTPGAARDYLAALQDVDLIEARRKRYRYVDPLLRLWARLHGKAAPPDDETLSRGARHYAAARLAAL